MEHHPDLFEEAKAFEKGDEASSTTGERFIGMGQGEPLETLEDPVRQAQIRANHQKKIARFNKRKRRNALLDEEDIIACSLD